MIENLNKTEGIERFLKAQESSYGVALQEVKEGEKRSHWMWYIFPQLRGLGRTSTANFYGINGLDEAKEYLKEPTLRARLLEISNVLLNLEQNDAEDIFGSTDAMKLRSCMTLFDLVEPNSTFDKVLSKFYNGKRCQLTLKLSEKM